MKSIKRAYQLTRSEAKAICDKYNDCNVCSLNTINGCLRSVAGYSKKEIFKKVEVPNYGDKK